MAEALSQAERAYDQVVEWLEHFEELEDPRQAGKVAYPRGKRCCCNACWPCWRGPEAVGQDIRRPHPRRSITR